MHDKALIRRERLVRSAARRIHRHGYERTSLADVAKGARVPPGGVYYYFKCKEDLIYATVEMRLNELEGRLTAWDELPDAKTRLEALINVWHEGSEVEARYGCPIGSLCYELAKAGGPAAKAAGRPLERTREWAAIQFREAGLSNPEGLAEHLTMALQGASLVANALRDPDALVRETDRLKKWIKSL